MLKTNYSEGERVFLINICRHYDPSAFGGVKRGKWEEKLDFHRRPARCSCCFFIQANSPITETCKQKRSGEYWNTIYESLREKRRGINI